MPESYRHGQSLLGDSQECSVTVGARGAPTGLLQGVHLPPVEQRKARVPSGHDPQWNYYAQLKGGPISLGQRDQYVPYGG